MQIKIGISRLMQIKKHFSDAIHILFSEVTLYYTSEMTIVNCKRSASSMMSQVLMIWVYIVFQALVHQLQPHAGVLWIYHPSCGNWKWKLLALAGSNLEQNGLVWTYLTGELLHADLQRPNPRQCNFSWKSFISFPGRLDEFWNRLEQW